MKVKVLTYYQGEIVQVLKDGGPLRFEELRRLLGLTRNELKEHVTVLKDCKLIEEKRQRTNRIFSALSIVLALSGCGKKDGGSNEAAADKSLFSKWTATTNGFPLDLTGGKIGANQLIIAFANGSSCTLTLTLTGGQTAGQYSVTNSTYAGGGPGDPGCSTLNETGSYGKSASELTMCSSACLKFK